MSAAFDSVIKLTLGYEGGFVNDPDDEGGPTNQGITLKFLIATEDLDLADIDRDGDIDIDDVRALRPETAAPIYEKYVWNKYRCNELPAKTSAVYFDMVVNHGPSNATMMLQRAINASGGDVDVDKKLGAETIATVNILHDASICENLLAERMKFYKAIIARKPSQVKFQNGWFARVEKLKAAVENI